MTWLSRATDIPADLLKVIAGFIGTMAAAAVWYLIGRFREPRRAVDAPTARIALDPTDRDLGYAIVRAANELAKGLHDHRDSLKDHAEILEGEKRSRRAHTRRGTVQ